MFDRWKKHKPPLSPRQRMISETEVFLTAALREEASGGGGSGGGGVPRVPRRRVDAGGFSKMIENPGARAAVIHWWSRTLKVVGAFEERS